MPCNFPLLGFWSKELSANGKRTVVFGSAERFTDLPVRVPCGRCIGCKLERSRQWAIRCVHEASLFESNCFITLTFDNEHLAKDRSLDKGDFQRFVKRLRKFHCDFVWSGVSGCYVRRSVRLRGSGIRYFHAGEYGELCAACSMSRGQCKCKKFVRVLGRPHHHACLFNFDFQDKVLWRVDKGVRLYRSATLEYLWGFGYASVGEVTFESAAYVARYVVKKISGDKALEHYAGKEPEYTTMSRRPGIGRGWFQKFGKDVFPNDYVVVRGGHKCKPPKYYSRCFEEKDLECYGKAVGYGKVCAKRQLAAAERERLREPVKFGEIARNVVKDICLRQKVTLLKRGLVNND